MVLSLLNKKKGNILWEQVVFILIIAGFAFIIMTFVTRFGSQAAIREEIYAKQIAVAIDKAKPGTGLVIDISEIIESANKNKFGGDFVRIDNENKKVVVRVTTGKGYSFGFFNDNQIAWNINLEEKGKEKLILRVENNNLGGENGKYRQSP